MDIPEESTKVEPADLKAILEELDAGAVGAFPEAALRQAQGLREEITPLLIEALRSATERARAGDAIEGNAHFFGVYLLTEFRAKEALPVFLDAIRLPGDVVDALFGDAVTELFSKTLAIFAEDRPEIAAELIDDPSVYEYVRWAAATAHEHWVRGEKMDSAQALERLRGHLRTAIERRDGVACGFLIYPLTVFALPSQIPEIAEALAHGLIDPTSFAGREIDDCEAQGQAGLEKRRSRLREAKVEDTLEELRRWFERGYYDSEDDDDEEDFGPDDYFDGEDDLDPDSKAARAAVMRMRGLMQRLGLESDVLPSDTSWLDRGETIRNEVPRVGRNDPCPCGSDKKFKKCCGRPS